MAIVFDKTNKVILIEKTQVEVTIQDLINSIRDFEGGWWGMDEPSLANAYGKQDLGGGSQVGITLELINNWRIQFEDRSGPDWINCYIKGGNLVAINDYDNNPIKPSAYVNIVIAQSTSPVIAFEWTQDEKDSIIDKLPDTYIAGEEDLITLKSDLETKHGTGSWEKGVERAKRRISPVTEI